MATAPPFRTKWTRADCRDVDTDADDNIYQTSATTPIKTDSNGETATFTASWRTDVVDSFSAVHLDKLQNLPLWAETGATESRIWRCTRGGSFVRKIGTRSGAVKENVPRRALFRTIFDVDSDAAGRIYVLEGLWVQVFDKHLGDNVVAAEQTWMAAPDNTWDCLAMVIKVDVVHIIREDATNVIIEKFDTAGVSQGTVTIPRGITAGTVLDATGLLLDTDGNYIISSNNTDNHRVQKFGSDGAAIWSLGKADGTSSAVNSEFNDPLGLCFSKTGLGHLWVAGEVNNRIQKFGPDRSFVLPDIEWKPTRIESQTGERRAIQDINTQMKGIIDEVRDSFAQAQADEHTNIVLIDPVTIGGTSTGETFTGPIIETDGGRWDGFPMEMMAKLINKAAAVGRDGVFRDQALLNFKVQATGTPSLQVDVLEGYGFKTDAGGKTFMLGNKETSIAQAVLAPTGAARIDLVTWLIRGGIAIVTGSEGGGAPSLPTESTLLARINLDVGDTQIDNSNLGNGFLEDYRTFL